MKVTEKIKQTAIDSLKPGLHSDGSNLYLQVTVNGATGVKRRSWVYRFRWQGRTREAGLGAYPKVSLKSARGLAEGMAVILQRGHDPIEQRNALKGKKRDDNEKTRMTLKRCVSTYIAVKKSSWSVSQKTRWEDPLRLHVYEKHGNTHIADIDDGTIRRILEPLWPTKNATAKHIRRNLEAVIAWAIYMKYRPQGPNPAAWKGALELHFDGAKKKQNYDAMPYKEVPAFMKKLVGMRSLAADALRFLILTATRTNETVGAAWAEIDFENRVWTIPKERMKAGKKHEVPLSGAALAILNHLHQHKISDYVFPGTDPTTHMEESTLRYFKHRMKVKATVHGFRSSFKDWCSEETEYPNEMSEMALAHVIPSAVEAAYRRGTLLKKRFSMMEDWGEYLNN